MCTTIHAYTQSESSKKNFCCSADQITVMLLRTFNVSLRCVYTGFLCVVWDERCTQSFYFQVNCSLFLSKFVNSSDTMVYAVFFCVRMIQISNFQNNNKLCKIASGIFTISWNFGQKGFLFLDQKVKYDTETAETL